MTRILLIMFLSLALLTSAAWATNPGGFVEPVSSTTVRTRPTAAEIAGFISSRGLFTFPAPWNTQGVRITNAGDCPGSTDCVEAVGYAYWANMNNHAASNLIYIFMSLKKSLGGGGLTLFSYNKTTDEVLNLGALFVPSDPYSDRLGENIYFSGTLPTKVYIRSAASASTMRRFDVLAKTFEDIYDIASRTDIFGAGKYIFQEHSSADDDAHSFSVRNTSDDTYAGSGTYKVSTGTFLYFPQLGFGYDECEVDLSGRWLTIKEKVSGASPQYDTRVIDLLSATGTRATDLSSGAERVILTQSGGGGHSALGYNYMAARDDYDAHPNAFKLWAFSSPELSGRLVMYGANGSGVAPHHVSHLNGVNASPRGQAVFGSSAWRVLTNRENEVVAFPLDQSDRVLIIAPTMTDLDAAGSGGTGVDYDKFPKGNVDVTGQYFIWTTNLMGARLDAIIVKVPSQLLQPPFWNSIQGPATLGGKVVIQ